MTRRYRPFDPFDRGGPLEGRELRIPRPPRRFWIGAALFGLALLIFFFASPVVWLLTELQWYDSLGFKDVFTTRLTLQVALFAGSLALAFIYLAANVVVALRLRAGPSLRAVGIRRSSIRSATGGAALGGAALIALVLSGGAGTQWQSLALFQHAKATGITDPVLGQDISFYLLTLPLLHSIVNWALGLGFLTPLLIGVIYAWRGDTFDLNLTPLAIAHLSALMAVFALVLAGWMWLGRYDLLYAHNSSIVWGAAYTDVNARLPIVTFQAGAAVVLGGALLVNIWLRRLLLPLTAAGVWVALLLIGQVYPAVVQSFLVTPNAQTYELPYIEREIAGTRAAYGLSNVAVSNFSVDQHLSYTHGYGVAASPVNAVIGEGLPDYVVGNLPPSGPLPVTQPAIYFGELRPPTGADYVLAPSNTREFDYPQGSQDVFTNYTGTHGVPMTSLNRALWSLKLGDFNLLVSGQITDKTLMLYRRNIVDRVSELAPFLSFDGDPYIVVVDGHLYWIIDAYTTGSTYPYSQTQAFQNSDINYIRNSVKVVIDAYEGMPTFYIVDPKDPLITAYAATFPSLFKPIDTMPAGVRAHIRVPVDLFNIQVNTYATYHVTADATGAKVFFAREDVWDIPTAQTSPG